MADLSALMGDASGFRPDARFASAEEAETPVMPMALAAMQGQFVKGGALRRVSFGGRHNEAIPAPDPIAEARAEGYQQGLMDAREAAEREAEDHALRREKLELTLRKLDGDLAEQFRQRLLETVVALCEATLAPLALDEAALIRRVERAAAMFTRADDERVLRLHPDDLALIRAQVPEDYVLTPAPDLPRGTIRVECRSNGMEVGGAEDGPDQWRRAIIEALDIGGLE
jgi:flagellar assembly protein FliH